MSLFKNVLPFLVSSLFCISLSANAAEVRADVASIVNDSGLNDLQKKSLMQYAESLETILDTNLQDRNAVIATNKEFMLAQTCLAHIYGIDQKPDMMRVSRKVFEKTFEEPRRKSARNRRGRERRGVIYLDENKTTPMGWFFNRITKGGMYEQ